MPQPSLDLVFVAAQIFLQHHSKVLISSSYSRRFFRHMTALTRTRSCREGPASPLPAAYKHVPQHRRHVPFPGRACWLPVLCNCRARRRHAAQGHPRRVRACVYSEHVRPVPRLGPRALRRALAGHVPGRRVFGLCLHARGVYGPVRAHESRGVSARREAAGVRCGGGRRAALVQPAPLCVGRADVARAELSWAFCM